MPTHREAWTEAVTKGTVGRPRVPQVARSKYGAVKTTVDGIVFHSKREAQRYHELTLRQKAGEIRGLVLQPKFDLYVHDLTVAAKLRRVAADVHGRRDRVPPVKVGVYIADFQYEEKGLSACENDRWNRIVEDVKGVKTDIYKLKKRMVEAQYGIQIRET